MNITIDDVVRRIKELASENPDYVYRPVNYSDCANVHETESGLVPGCIVGKALIDLGVPPGWFVENDLVESGSYVVMKTLGVITGRDHLNDHRFRFIDSVQGHQDDAETWGDAVAYAAERYLEAK